LTKNAKAGEIKSAYYKLCYQYHPDRTGGSMQDRFKEINAAYEVLGNETKRKQYDEMRDQSKQSD
jgi:DnaJ-class molecular chaperone